MEPSYFDRDFSVVATTEKRAGFRVAEHSKLIASGFLATLAMTLVVYVGPLIGLPNLDFAAMLGSLGVGHAPRLFTGAWWTGMIWHIINGSILLPLLFAKIVFPKGMAQIPTVSHYAWKTTAFAVALWFLSQTLAMPMVGGGFFSEETSMPALIVLGSLVAHLCYGLVLGSLVRSEPERLEVAYREDQAA